MTDYIIAGVMLIVIMIAIFSIKKKAKNKASCLCGKKPEIKNHCGKENLLCRGDALPELREPCHGGCAGHSRHFRIRQFEERTCDRVHGNARG